MHSTHLDPPDLHLGDADLTDADLTDADLTDGGVVDTHVHLLPGRLGTKVRAVFEDLGGYTLAYPSDHAEICEQLAHEGVAAVWTLPYAHRPGVASWLNDAAAATASRPLAVHVTAGATVHPGDEDPVAVVRAAVEHGGARVLKLHCSVGGFDVTDEGLAAVWDYAEQIHLPVVVHAGHGVHGRTETDELAPLATIIDRHPEARLVIAHCGHHAVDAALDLLEAGDHVMADLTPVVNQVVAITPQRAERMSSRLLFGTDAPNTELGVVSCLAHLDTLGLSAAQRAAVVGGNARRLLAEVLT